MKTTAARLATLFATCASYEMVCVSPYSDKVTLKFTFSNGVNVRVVTNMDEVEKAENNA